MSEQEQISNFKAHLPQHPLPAEIRDMGRDDTVCKFCGVSYLIHSEIKRLEDQLQDVLDELLHLRGCEKREEALRVQLREQDTIRVNLEASIVTVETAIAQLLSDNKKLESNSAELDEKTEIVNGLKQKLSPIIQWFPSALIQLKEYKHNLQLMKSGLTEQLSLQQQNSQQLLTHVSQIHQLYVDSEQTHQQALDDLSEEKDALKSRAEKMEVSLASHEISCSEIQQLRQDLRDVETSKDIAESKSKSLGIELEQCQKQLDQQTSNLEELRIQSRENERNAHEVISRMKTELQGKDGEQKNFQHEMNNLNQKFSEMQRQNKEISARASSSKGQSQDLKERLDQALRDVDAMRAEREMTITAHQNQIEQLRESFKQRVEEADKWPIKLEEVQSAERKKHATEMDALEEKLKQNFVMEMQIEQQKHQQMLTRLQTESRSNENSLRNQITDMETQQRSKVAELQKQSDEDNARAFDNDHALRAEVTSLKTIIAELEGRLSKLDIGSERRIAELKGQTSSLRNELIECKTGSETLDKELGTAKEEVAFLQEMVRRECEERFELTEALSQTKEELMTLKRPLGGFVSSNRTGSSKPTNENGRKTPSEELTILRKRSVVTRMPSGDDSLDSNGVNPGFIGDAVRPSSQQKGMKGMSLTESRKRIAQAVGRKSSS